jgi:hypothetical protein
MDALIGPLGILVKADSAVSPAATKFLLPKEVLISNGVVNKCA